MLIFARKKNQGKGEAGAKRKAKGDEIVREMYILKALFQDVGILTASPDPKFHRRCSSSIILP